MLHVRICRCVFTVDYIPKLLDSQHMTRVRDDILLKAFANVLRSLRQELGISQEQLALRANVDRTFVGKLEAARHQPSLAVVFKLSQALGKTPEHLVGLVRASQESVEQTPASEG